VPEDLKLPTSIDIGLDSSRLPPKLLLKVPLIAFTEDSAFVVNLGDEDTFTLAPKEEEVPTLRDSLEPVEILLVLVSPGAAINSVGMKDAS
tara:strand:+ start:513 stop:785 length:273 start_codon:yes stop_codon:yes gene_type:complete